MSLSSLFFGSYLTYTPRGTSEEAKKSQQITYAIKQEKTLQTGEPYSKYLVGLISDELQTLPFKTFFGDDTYLVPVPKTSLMKPGTLWVPLKIAEAMESKRLGKVMNCLERIKPLPKSATSAPQDRPKASDHQNSIIVKPGIQRPEKIVLIDDIVTRGATLFGCANRLREIFPQASIFGFALIRTISNEEHFLQIKDPCVGTITLLGEVTFRTP